MQSIPSSIGQDSRIDSPIIHASISPTTSIEELSSFVPKTLAPISPSLAGRKVFTIDDIETEEVLISSSHDNASDPKTPQEVLEHVKELAGDTASLKQYLIALNSTSGKALEDKKSMAANFKRYAEQYQVLREMAYQLSDSAFATEKALSQKIAKGNRWQAPLTELAKKHLRLIGTNMKGIEKQETHYQEQKTQATTALADLHSHWNALCANLSEAHSLLAWLEVLQTKPENIEKERFYAEFLFQDKSHLDVLQSDLPSMHEKTPLLGRLERLLGEMAQLQVEAASLAHSASLNPEKNAFKIETKYLVTAAKFGRLLLESFPPLFEEVPQHLQTLETTIAASECLPLKPKAWKSLSHYHRLDVEAIRHAEQQHQQDQNDWNTELKQVQSIWQSLTCALEATRENINTVASVLNLHLKTTYEPFESPIPQPVQVMTPVKIEETDKTDETESCLKEAEALLQSMEASIEVAKSHYSSWGRPTPQQVDLVRNSYTSHYESFQSLSRQLIEVVEMHKSALGLINQLLPTCTLPPIPEDMKAYMQAYGKLKGQEDKYTAKFQKIAKNSIHYHQQRAHFIEKETKSKETLNRLEQIRKNLSERLCRLAEGYEKGYLSWQTINNLQGNTYSTPPEPAVLQAKFASAPALDS